MNFKKITTFTRERDFKCDHKLLTRKKNIYVHTGKKFVKVNKTIHALKMSLGVFAITKRIGREIHNSERNKKRRNKQRKK